MTEVVLFRQLKDVFGVSYSKQHLSRLEKCGQFPRRLHLSARKVAWRSAEIQKWLDDKAAARPGC